MAASTKQLTSGLDCRGVVTGERYDALVDRVDDQPTGIRRLGRTRGGGRRHRVDERSALAGIRHEQCSCGGANRGKDRLVVERREEASIDDGAAHPITIIQEVGGLQVLPSIRLLKRMDIDRAYGPLSTRVCTRPGAMRLCSSPGTEIVGVL